MDERKLTRGGGDRRSESKAPNGANGGKSASDTAELLGVSPRTVERVRTVLDHAPETVKEAVLSGSQSVNAAYTETQEHEALRHIETHMSH